MNDHLPLLRKARASWLYPIYVPSYSRAGEAPLLNLLAKAHPAAQAKVHVVVRPDEAKRYAKKYPFFTIVKEGRHGIGPARMRCLIDADKRGYKNIVVLDDDILHVSLLERIKQESGKWHTRRFSAKVSGIPDPKLLVLSLAVGCKLASAVFRKMPEAAYGAARNALFSGDQPTDVGATLMKGSFPACVMFFDVERFTLREVPREYDFHGEDLAMFLDTLSEGQLAFTLPTVAYDQSSTIETTIPLDPLDEVGRRPDLENAEAYYPKLFPYLRVSVKNKAGGVMRIGVAWPRWYKDTGTAPVEIPLDDLI